jgi:hypothetical protein
MFMRACFVVLQVPMELNVAANKALVRVLNTPNLQESFVRLWYKLMQYSIRQSSQRAINCLEAFVRCHAAGLAAGPSAARQ